MRARTTPALVALLAAPALSQNTYYVDDDAAPGGDGSSWGAAFADLQDALNAHAIEGGAGLIRLAAGTYFPSLRSDPGDPRSASFYLAPELRIEGGYAGPAQPDERDTLRYESVLDGDIGSPGFAPDNCRHVVIAKSVDSSAILDGVVVQNGYSESKAGGGLVVEGAEALFLDCTFRSNWAGFEGGAVDLDGRATFDGCRFIGNTVDPLGEGGAAVYARDGGTLLRCTFEDNGPCPRGGAVYWDTGHPSSIVGCLFAGNRAGVGAAIYQAKGLLHVNHCTIHDNLGSNNGAVFAASLSTLDLQNSVLWGNGVPPLDAHHQRDVSVSHCVIEGGYDGAVASLDADPLWIDPANRDYRLGCGSPCIDSGNTARVLAVSDLEGDDRVVDGDSDGVAQVDMGADEFDAAWSAEGALVVGGSLRFRFTAPPAEAGNLAAVFLSQGTGGAGGGIPVPGTEEWIALEPDWLFYTWNGCPTVFRVVPVAECPGVVTAPFPLDPSLAGFFAHFAGVSVAPEGAVVSVTPTRAFVIGAGTP